MINEYARIIVLLAMHLIISCTQLDLDRMEIASNRSYVRTMKSTIEKMSNSKCTSINDTLTEVIDSAGGLANTRSAVKIVNKYPISNQKTKIQVII